MAFQPEFGVTLNNTLQLDAFHRLRVSSPHLLASSLPVLNKMPRYWNETIVNASGNTTSVKHAYRPSIVLTCGATVGDGVLREQKVYNVYQAGQSQKATLTGVLTAEANYAKWMGYGDALDGIFLGYNGTGHVLRFRTSVDTGTAVDTDVAQATWNVDPMDGTGPSGVTVDWTKGQIFAVDLQFLALGRIRCYLDIDGAPYLIHEFKHSNIIARPYWRTASLPTRFEIRALAGAAGTATFETICAENTREGGDIPGGTSVGVSTNVAATAPTVTTTERSILSIRLRDAARLGAHLRPYGAQVHPLGSSIVRWRLLFNPTVAGLSWSDTGDVAQVSTTQSTVTSPGYVVASGYVERAASSVSGSVDLPLYANVYVGNNVTTSDVLVLSVQQVSGTDSVHAAMRFFEVY